MSEEWKIISYDPRYQVSNFGRFRKRNPKNGYRYLKPFKKHNLYVIKINGKEYNTAKLVVEAFIKKLNDNERVYHKNKMPKDNYIRNLEIVTLKELGKRTGYISKSQAVVEVKDDEILRTWRSARKASKALYISYQTVCDYCNNKVTKPMYNLMWEDDYFKMIER